MKIFNLNYSIYVKLTEKGFEHLANSFSDVLTIKDIDTVTYWTVSYTHLTLPTILLV